MTSRGEPAHSPSERGPSTFTPSFDSPPPPDRVAFDAYLTAVRRRWRVVLAVPIALASIAVGLSMSRARSYVARTAFISTEPNSPSGAIGSLGAVASQLGIPALSAIAQGSATLGPQFYGDLLTSNALLHSLVVTRFDASNPGEFGGKPFRGTLVEYFDGYGKTPEDREIDAMNKLRRWLNVAVDRPTGVVRFQVQTKNRVLSALIARQLLDLINDFNLRRRQTQAGNERDFAARRASTAADSLHLAERTLADFRTANIDFSRSPRLSERETELQRRVTMAQQIYMTVAQRYETANLEAVRNTPVITVLDAPEGVVEARPRYTITIAAGVFLAGLVISVAIALRLEAVVGFNENRI